MKDKVPISILIPTKNEAHQLPRCLDSIHWADEIFFVDSQSTDTTKNIANAAGAHVVQFHFNGTWPKKKNWALENIPFKHPWVLILDADEVMPPEAKEEIRKIVTDPGCPHSGYWINRRFYFLDKPLKHAYFPNWNLRLVQHKHARYEALTKQATESGDNEVHEHMAVQGSTGRLTSVMDHHAFPSIEVFIEKHNRYSNWEARIALEKNTNNPSASLDQGTSSKRLLKQLVRHLPFRPTLRFLYVYLVQGGILDGRRGYYFARLHGLYEFLNVAKTYELKLKQQAKSPAQHQAP